MKPPVNFRRRGNNAELAFRLDVCVINCGVELRCGYRCEVEFDRLPRCITA
jgi:hypothetical protein